MPRKEKKPKRLSGTIKDLPLADYPEEQTNIKGGGSSSTSYSSSASSREIISPRDSASGLPTGKRQ